MNRRLGSTYDGKYVLIWTICHFFKFWIIGINYGFETWIKFHSFQWMPYVFLSDCVHWSHLSIHNFLSETGLVVKDHIILMVSLFSNH